jgi:transcription antitermination factor NusG
MPWYVVEAKEGRVRQAYGRLAYMGLDVRMPTIIRRDPRRGRAGVKREDIHIPRFGRYLFANIEQLTAVLWNAIDSQPDVRGLLVSALGDRPQPLPDEYMPSLLARVEEEGRPTKNPYSVGQRVQIVDGPLCGHFASIQAIDGARAVVLAVDFLGKASLIPFQVSHVAAEIRPSRLPTTPVRSLVCA